jgi:peptidoglycan/xylan/chitin deacetylase (PgdA/CDA1 family)/pimeloyl-ACP methyl ester carboxylesterase
MMKSAILSLMLMIVFAIPQQPPAIPPKTVVLTFDDAVKSHVTVVAPYLKQLGFQATFFITQNWMKDTANFLSWEDVAEIHRMGFEIGNHSWTHADFGKVENGARLGEELDQVEKELAKVGVPKPVSFAWCGNTFGPEAIRQLRVFGYKLARRGMQPEKPYGKIELGPALDVSKYHPLLIPTTGDAYPDWTLDHFKKVVNSAKPGEAVVLQFHGVPDVAHPWVHTPPEAFKQYMTWLKENGYHAIAMRDLLPYYNAAQLPDDPMLKLRLSPSMPPGGPAPERVSFKTADGGVDYGDLYGKGDRGLVLVHGGRFIKESWWKQARALADAGFRVLAIDLRGYVKSKGPGDSNTSEAFYQDVLGAVRYLRKNGAQTVSLIGASFGGGAAAEAMIRDEAGEVDRVVFLASEGSDTPEKIKGRKLFLIARDDANSGGPRLPTIQKAYEKIPGPKELIILDGSAHSQFLFGTDQADRVMREILRFLNAP